MTELSLKATSVRARRRPPHAHAHIASGVRYRDCWTACREWNRSKLYPAA